MSVKALLLATLTMGGQAPQVVSTSTTLDSSDQCVPAMYQVAKHHSMTNHILSRGREYIKAQKTTGNGLVVLNISCKELKE